MTHLTLITSSLFDPKLKQWRKNISVQVDTVTGLIVRVSEREDVSEVVLEDGDIDLRGKYVLPGLVDAHTHIFLHSYESVALYIRCGRL